MKITIAEPGREAAFEGGWVNLPRTQSGSGEAPFKWKLVVRVEDSPEGSALTGEIASRARLLGRWSPGKETRAPLELAEGDDSPREETLDPWAITDVEIAVTACRQGHPDLKRTARVRVVPFWYRWAAYGMIGVAFGIGLGLDWSLLEDSVSLGIGDDRWRWILTLVTAAAPALASVGGSKLVDVVSRTVAKLASRSDGTRSRRLVQEQPLAISLGLCAIAALLPMTFVRVANLTEGTPTLAGEDQSLKAYGKALVWSPFSTPALAAKDDAAFQLVKGAPEKAGGPASAGTDASPSGRAPAPSACPSGKSTGDKQAERPGEKAPWNLLRRSVDVQCHPRPWNGFGLATDASCNLHDGQILDWHCPEPKPGHAGEPALQPRCKLLTDSCPSLAAKESCSLEGTPFGGPVRFAFPNGTLKCDPPKKAPFHVHPLEVDPGSVAEVLVRCRRGFDDYAFVTQLLPTKDTGKDERRSCTTKTSLPLCLPDEEVDCQLLITGKADAFATLPAQFLQSRRISTNATICSVGYADDKDGKALLGTVRVTAPGRSGMRIRMESSVCETLAGDGDKGEQWAIVASKPDLTITADDAPIGTTISSALFGARDELTVGVEGHDTFKGKALCHAGASRLILVDATDLVAGAEIHWNNRGAPVGSVSEILDHGAKRRGAWLCLDPEDGQRAHPAEPRKAEPGKIQGTERLRSPKVTPNSSQEAQCQDARNTDASWVDLSTSTARLCKPPPRLCCHVCLQYRADLAKSNLRIVRPCGSDPKSPGRQVGPQECRSYEISEVPCP